MATKVFVNLPVSDLKRSKAFFSSLGYTFNTQFTDETAACMVVSDDIFVMLLTMPKFKSFTQGDLHVRTWFSGFGWPHVGVGVHGAERNQAVLKRTLKALAGRRLEPLACS